MKTLFAILLVAVAVQANPTITTVKSDGTSVSRPMTDAECAAGGMVKSNGVWQMPQPVVVANPDYTYYWWLDSIARKYIGTNGSQGLPVNPQTLTLAILTALNSETNGVTAARISGDGMSAAFCYQQLGGDTRDYSIVPPATVPQ